MGEGLFQRELIALIDQMWQRCLEVRESADVRAVFLLRGGRRSGQRMSGLNSTRDGSFRTELLQRLAALILLQPIEEHATASLVRLAQSRATDAMVESCMHNVPMRTCSFTCMGWR